MAIDAPRGLQIIGNPSDLEVIEMVVTDSATVYIGDLLMEGGTSGTVTRFTSQGTAYAAGVALGSATGSGVTVKVPVCIDPRAKFLIQCDDSGTALAATDIFSYFSVLWSGAGSNGISNMELDVNAGAGATDPLVVLDIAEGPDPTGGSLPTFAAARCQAIVKLRPTRMVLAGAEA